MGPSLAAPMTKNEVFTTQLSVPVGYGPYGYACYVPPSTCFVLCAMVCLDFCLQLKAVALSLVQMPA